MLDTYCLLMMLYWMRNQVISLLGCFFEIPMLKMPTLIKQSLKKTYQSLKKTKKIRSNILICDSNSGNHTVSCYINYGEEILIIVNNLFNNN